MLISEIREIEAQISVKKSYFTDLDHHQQPDTADAHVQQIGGGRRRRADLEQPQNRGTSDQRN